MARRAPLKAAGEPRAPIFVSYLRVSTAMQGASGLGLEAQREAIDRHVRQAGGKLLSEHIEIESGKKNDRPEIAKALAAARAKRATLIIAKLDRLARNVAFISNLMESGVDFVAVDLPQANRLTVHILAAVAEHEAKMISERTKAALAAAKARGQQLGGDRGARLTAKARQAGCKAVTARADAFAADIAPAVAELQAAGAH